MQAIILAAGMGKRLKELTQNNTKCMVKVNGVTLIDRLLHQIEKLHLSRIIIVIGYEGQKLIDYIGTLGIQTQIVYIKNPVYDKTNNIYSLALAKDWLVKDEDLLRDIRYERKAMDDIHSCLKKNGHPLRHWYYGHFHESWHSEIEGIRYNMLDIMELRELR